ncbi:MAG: hypothetical protein HC915_08225 [Anaerolineae bacterium]|nr:hypothetical protein [Anaerolineae bacterium]
MLIQSFPSQVEFDHYLLLDPQMLFEASCQAGVALSAAEQEAVRQRISTAQATCARIYLDIQLTQALQALVEDWLLALRNDSGAWYGFPSVLQAGDPRH